MIRRKIYISRAMCEVTPDTVSHILTTSRHNNQRDGLSGLLIFDEGQFFQILEGPDPQLSTCFARIMQDARHGEIRLMSDQLQPQRAFPDWKMGYARPQDLSDAERHAVRALTTLAEQDAAALITQDIHALIDAFLDVFDRTDEAASLDVA